MVCVIGGSTVDVDDDGINFWFCFEARFERVVGTIVVVVTSVVIMVVKLDPAKSCEGGPSK